jgi:crotonobetainyl-CoA:carnitine CoA-transferase CaiB-like acyl-CoA transferase
MSIDASLNPRSQDAPHGASGPLEGVRVLELGALLAGPFAGRLLADLGAEVIKIEAPDRPDPMRDWGQESYQGRNLWWPVISRNKRSVTLNLRTEAGQALLLDLVAKSDAIVENFRPGTLERWGLGYERLTEVNPGILLIRVRLRPDRALPGSRRLRRGRGGNGRTTVHQRPSRGDPTAVRDLPR